MKKITVLILALTALVQTASSYAQTLYVDGSVLKDASGNPIILRGVNYPIIDDYDVQLNNYAVVEHKIDQVALSGANCIRLQWYTNGVHYKDQYDPAIHPGYGPGTLDGYVNNGHLSHLITYARTKGMITILELHDLTGSTDDALFQSQIMGFWNDPDVLQLIEENKGHIIVNFANEYGKVRFTGNQAAASAAFRDTYVAAIQSFRANNVTVPIMIDAPDFGQSSTELLNVSGNLYSADFTGNIIFSAHAYWYAYANNLSAIQTKLNEFSTSNKCWVFGEIANSQADAPNYCGELDISNLYPMILEEACTRNLGWLAWSWDQDCDNNREIAAGGEIANLTPYGNDIINNANYGLLSTSGCGAEPLATIDAGLSSNEIQFKVWPNPVQTLLNLETEVERFTVKDNQGKIVSSKNTPTTNIQVTDLAAGQYTIELFVNGVRVVKPFTKF